ncbi:MAG: OmpA family protein [Ignavibacteria bacterium]|nr:OmpA family protein [Ignavibacteria bacterium]
MNGSSPSSRRIAANSTVTVEGHTDRSGEAEYNQKLSQRRADATASRLKVPADRAKGFGSSDLLYDNATPEGRLYCLTVPI